MEELQLGPNGSLVYCMEYLLDNMDWLQDHLDTYDDDEYLIIDCPGQIELYTHIPVMNKIIDQLRTWGYGESMVSVFVVDATFVTDPAKFISGEYYIIRRTIETITMRRVVCAQVKYYDRAILFTLFLPCNYSFIIGSLLALSAMIAMQLPHVNVLSKCDLVEEASMDRVLEMESAIQLWDMMGDHSSDSFALQAYNHVVPDTNNSTTATTTNNNNNAQQRARKWSRLTESICSLLDDYSMVGFVPLNINDEDSIAHVLATVDHATQYGEDLEVRGADYDDDVGEEG